MSRRRAVLRTLVSERDRLFTIASFIAFAAWSVAEPTPSMAQLPDLVEYASYALFLIGGAALAWGSCRTCMPAFVTGHILIVAGLLTVAGVILTTSESPVAALIFGYATAMSYSLQKTLRERALIREIAERTAPLPTVPRGGTDDRWPR